MKKENQKIIGDVNLVHKSDMGKKEVEVHLMLAYIEDWESGIGGEALKLVEEYVKEHVHANKILARVASNTMLN